MLVIGDPILPRDHRWEAFLERLSGPGFCAWQETWTCHGDLRFTKKVLAEMGLSPQAIAVSLQYFMNHGGYCDCEVVMNVH
ncbi:MAG: DUF2695 domain-containing protein [Candidatus Dormibacteria bacterium]